MFGKATDIHPRGGVTTTRIQNNTNQPGPAPPTKAGNDAAQ
ncbi:hypothetical protein [Aliivibrio fischeri]|nr:hypothetical protein [Aliivibrio fischeri]